jgi:hypothetical protein
VKVLFATCDKPAATSDTDNATDTVSIVAKSEGGSG